MSKYPVGAKWKAEGKSIGMGFPMFGYIWLQSRKILCDGRPFEIWNWSLHYTDGSYEGGNWNTSYRLCKEEIPLDARFKRIN